MVAAFTLQWQSWVVSTETMACKSTIFTVWLFTESLPTPAVGASLWDDGGSTWTETWKSHINTLMATNVWSLCCPHAFLALSCFLGKDLSHTLVTSSQLQRAGYSLAWPRSTQDARTPWDSTRPPPHLRWHTCFRAWHLSAPLEPLPWEPLPGSKGDQKIDS